MYSFVLPLVTSSISSQRHQPARCTLNTPATPRKRLKRWEQLTNSINESTMPPEFLTEVKRLIRARAFMSKVANDFAWPYFRFTGLLFKLAPISETCPDRYPEELRELRHNADVKTVCLPRGLLRQARARCGCELNVNGIEICAVFEIYGEDVKTIIDAKIQRDFAKRDVEKQFRTWSDTGQSMRTETNNNTVDIPELFHEDTLDFIDF